MASKIIPTAEQQAILSAFSTGGHLAITAGAGTGKTSTLRLLAEANPGRRMLYLAYNKSVQEAAAATFPPNVEVRTAHSLAYASYGRPLQARLRGTGPRQSSADVARLIGVTQAQRWQPPNREDEPAHYSPGRQVTVASAMVRHWMLSRRPAPDATDYIPSPGVTANQAKWVPTWAVPLAQKVWTAMRAGPLTVTHDVYLRLWADSHPRLDRWDVVLLDEAQDADPLIAAVVAEQVTNAQVVVVGDSSQAIYGWRGATDFLARFPADNRLALTQSFRFGVDVATRANRWLTQLGAPLRLTGTPGHRPGVGAGAVLCRSNAGVLSAAMAALEDGQRVHIVGEGREIKAFAEAARDLQHGKWTSHPTLTVFKAWTDVVAYAKTDEGRDLKMMVSLVERIGAGEIIRAVQSCVPAEESHDVVVSTAHKAKGLEWPSVRVADDFHSPGRDKTSGELLPISPAEAMLCYVTVTRAQTELTDEALDWLDTYLGPGGPAPVPATPVTPTPPPAKATAKRPKPSTPKPKPAPKPVLVGAGRTVLTRHFSQIKEEGVSL